MMSQSVLLAAIGEVNDAIPEAEAVWRLLAAAVLGSMVGFEREVSDQPAGLRTHLTVALGAAVFGVVSTLGFSEFVTDQRDVNIQFDVTRVASQVVVGIGFLGAGMIFRAGSKIRNLTTAASLWVTAAIGLSCGVGDIGVATVATAALIVALLLLRFPRDLIRKRITRTSVVASVRLADIDAAEAVLAAVRTLEGVSITHQGWSKTNGHPVLEFTLEGDPEVRPDVRLRSIVARSDVLDVQTDVGLWNRMADD